MKIHFICRGNVLRSVIAEAYLRSLDLPAIEVSSSGTNVDLTSASERAFFDRTLALLDRHSLKQCAKQTSDQLTQERLDKADDLVICMNERVYDEAAKIVYLPPSTVVWDIVDIGEGDRTALEDTDAYEEQIFSEIKTCVDALLRDLPRH